jgi:hypothetical protein
VTGQTASSTTHTGGGVTVHDADNPDTYFGVSPGLGYLAGGASNAAPAKHTYTGADPTTQEPAADTPYVPVTPQPTPIDTPPNNIQVDVGNSDLSPTELTNLFAGFMKPGRPSRGRNPVSVIV